MNFDDNKAMQTLLKKADADFKSALKLIEYEPIILDTAAFHCQQAIEKYLNAYLVFMQIDYPRSHNLESLLDLIHATDNSFEDFHFLNLTSFAVEIRYTDDYLIPDIEEMKAYLFLVEKVKNIVLFKIKTTCQQKHQN